MKKILLLIYLLAAFSIKAQVTFEKVFYNLGFASFSIVDNTLDSGFIISGIKNSQPFIAKIDRYGDTLFTKSIPHSAVYGSEGCGIVQNNTGDYTIGFTFDSTGTTSNHFASVCTLDTALSTYSNCQTFPSIGAFGTYFIYLKNSKDKSQIVYLVLDSDFGGHDYVSACPYFYYGQLPVTSYYSENPIAVNNSGLKYYVEFMDEYITPQGDTLSFPCHTYNSNTIETYNELSFSSLSVQSCCTADNGIILAGKFQDGIKMVKLSSSGTILWEKDFLNLGNPEVNDVIETDDGGVALNIIKYAFGANRMGILKLDSSISTIQFINLFSQSIGYFSKSNIKQLPDGYVLFSNHQSLPYLVKANINGRTDTSFSITSSSHDYCNGDTCILSTQQAASYLWNNGDTTQSISVTQNGIYFAQTTDSIGNQFLSQGFQVIFHSPSISLGNDTTLCTTQSITLNAGNGFVNYLWEDSSTAQTLLATSTTADTLSYSVQVTDTNGCTNGDTLQIIFDICAGINSTNENQFSFSPNPARSPSPLGPSLSSEKKPK